MPSLFNLNASINVIIVIQKHASFNGCVVLLSVKNNHHGIFISTLLKAKIGETTLEFFHKQTLRVYMFHATF